MHSECMLQTEICLLKFLNKQTISERHTKKHSRLRDFEV
jgi:hypothetical protein